MGVWSREGGPIRSLVRLSSRPARRLSAALPALLLIASLLVGLGPAVALAQAKPGTVTGTVFRDDDGNGKRDGNAAGVAGVTVTIANGRWQAQAVTGSDGSFRFADLLEATYNVRIVPPDGYRRTTPDSLNARVSPGATVQADFGLMRATPTPTPPPATPTRGATPTSAGAARASKSSATPGGAKPEIEPKPEAKPDSKPETRALVPNAPSLIRPSPTAEAAEDDEEDAPPPRSALFPGAPARLTPVVAASGTPVGDGTATPSATVTPTPRPAPRFGGRSPGLSRPEPPTWPREPAPVEADALDRFLAARDSPMAGLGKKLLDVGWRYNVDPRLLVAIAGADTSFGRALCTDYNAWNWFWFEWCNSPFESWEQAAEEVARGLRVGYLDQGLTDVDKIADRYGPLDDPRDTLGLNRHWPVNVSRYIEQLGGSRCNLTWTRTGTTCAPPRPTPTPRPPTATPAAQATAAPPEEPAARLRADRTRADARVRPPVTDNENGNDNGAGLADEAPPPPDAELTAQEPGEDDSLHPSDRAASAIGTPVPATATPAAPATPPSIAETTPEDAAPDTAVLTAADGHSEPDAGPLPAILLAIGLLGVLLIAARAARIGPLHGRALPLGPIRAYVPRRVLHRLGQLQSSRRPEPDFAGPGRTRWALPRLRLPRFRPFRGRGATDRGVLS